MKDSKPAQPSYDKTRPGLGESGASLKYSREPLMGASFTERSLAFVSVSEFEASTQKESLPHSKPTRGPVLTMENYFSETI